MYNKRLSTLIAIFTLTACTKSSVTVYLHDPLDPSQFTGLKRVADNGNGTYQLTWEVLPSNLKIASKAKYGIFAREAPPSNLMDKFLNLFFSSNEYSFNAPLASIDYKIGSYTTPILAFKDNTCFVVRVIGASEFNDVNNVEVCTGHVKTSFAGAKVISANNDNSYNITWDALPYVNSNYHIFTRDEANGRYDFSDPTAIINNVTAWQTSILTYKPSQCFIVRAAPVNTDIVDNNINEVCTGHHQSFYTGIRSLTALGGGSYKLEWPESSLENTSYKVFERSAIGQYDAQNPIATSSELSYTQTGITDNYCYLVRAVSTTSSFVDNNLKELCITPQVYGNFSGITNSEVLGTDVKLNIDWATGATAMRVLRDGTTISEKTDAQNFTYTDSNAAGTIEHLYQTQAIIGGEVLAGTTAHTITTANVGNFVGCSSVTALSDSKIQVNYVWPIIDGHTVSGITIYRNGVLLSTQVSPGISKYVDSGFSEQQSARYICKIIIDNVEISGKQSLAAVTLETTPTETATATATEASTEAPTPTPTATPIPIAPNVTSLLAVPTSNSIIGLTWTSGGGSTSGYIASYASGATPPASCATGTSITAGQISGTTASISGLTAATQYSFRVCAINGNPTPDIAAGTTATTTTLQAAPPNATGLGATATSDTTIGLSWTSGGGSSTAYRISYASSATPPATCADGTVFSAGQAGTTASITGLTAATQYSFRVCAINSNATPDIASGVTANATTLQAVPPNATGLGATVSSDTTISLAWTSDAGSTAAYSVSYAIGASAPANCAAGTVFSSGQVGTTASITGLAANTQYSFRVCAINGNTTPDIASGATTTATTIKAAPTDLSGTGGSNLVTLSWTTVSGATNYAIYYSTSAGITKSATRVVAAAPSYQVTELSSHTTYYFNIAAIIGGIESDLSNHEASATSITTVASKLVFGASSPSATITNTCTGPFTVEAQDAGSSAVAVNPAITVSLSKNLGATGTFYATTGCADGVITQVNIAQYQSQAQFWFKNSAVESSTITAASASVTSATRNVTSAAPAPFGETWRNVDGNGEYIYYPYQVLISDNGNKVFLTKAIDLSGAGAICVSTDGGVNFVDIAGTNGFRDIAASSDMSKLMMVSAGYDHPKYSTDSGATWNSYTGGWQYYNYKSVAMSNDGSNVWMSGTNVFKSTNGGVSFTQITMPINYFYAIKVSGDGQKVLGVTDNSAGYLSTDAGATWFTRSFSALSQFHAGDGRSRAIDMSEDGSVIVALGGLGTAPWEPC